MKKSEQLALAISGLVSGISTLFKPIVWFLSLSTNAVLRLFGIDPTEADDEVSEEEIRMMVDAGSEKGAIDYEEKEFIQNVFEFDEHAMSVKLPLIVPTSPFFFSKTAMKNGNRSFTTAAIPFIRSVTIPRIR